MNLGGLKRRRQPERHASQQPERQIEGQNAVVETDRPERRQVARDPRNQQVLAQECQGQADDSPKQTQQHALRKKLPEDAALARAQGAPDGHLFVARGGARKQQVGDVHAGDQQHKADRAQEDEQRTPGAARHSFVPLRHHHAPLFAELTHERRRSSPAVPSAHRWR